MSKTFRAALAFCISLLCGTSSFAGDPRVRSMGDAFVAGLPADWSVASGAWSYLDIVE
jgi:hypothetical protein